MTPEEKLVEIEKALRGIIATIDKHYDHDESGAIVDRFYDGYRSAMASILESFFEKDES